MTQSLDLTNKASVQEQKTRKAAPASTIRDLIKAQTPAIAMAIGGSTPAERAQRAERFARVVMTAVTRTPALARCSAQSFAGAMMTCAQLGLDPNTPQGFAYLIPYGSECQFQLGYRGMIQLMWRSGLVSSFNADVVYEQEVKMGLFSYASGACPLIRHEIDLTHPEYRTGEVIAAYACCTLKTGQTIMRVVDRAEIDAARKLAGRNSPAWRDHFAAMAVKTAIKRLAAWMPLECPALYKADLDGAEADEDTEALRFGSMAHTLILEPEQYPLEYAVTDLNLATKEGKAFKAGLPDGVEIVKTDKYEKAQMMAEAVRSHPQAKMLFMDYKAEIPVYWMEDDLACKCKPDLISTVFGHRFLGDLKTTESVNPDAIQKSIMKYGYYRQAAWYLHGMEMLGKPCDAFVFIFVEKKFPHLVTMCQLSDEWIARGWDECCRAMQILRDCRKTGLYPCYTRDILTLDMPAWAKGA